MKRLLAKLALLGFLVTTTLLFPFYTSFPYRHNISLVINKLAIVKESPSPRMIFVGGSGTYSGLDSRLVHAEMNYSVANMAVYAGYGVLPVLHLVEPSLKAGDVVVIIPEYGVIHAGLTNTDRTRKWLLAASPLASVGRYYPLSPTGLKELLKDLAELAASKLKVLPKSLFSSTPEGYYKYKRVMDEFGDMTVRAQFRKLPPDKLHERGIVYPRKPVDAAAIEGLNAFAQSAERAGCRVFFIFPAFPEKEYQLNREYFDAICEQLHKQLKFPILGTPYDFLYPYQYFQDTVNHLDSRGKALRTRKVIELLKANLPHMCRVHS